MNTITLPGNPLAKARHRSFLRCGHIASYDPQHKEKDAVKALIKRQTTNAPSNAASGFDVNIDFYLPLANSRSKRDMVSALWLNQIIGKPDLDNLAKFYLDAANGILWHDDKQIISLNLKKRYSENPRTEITVMENQTATIDEKALDILDLFTPLKCQKAFRILETICASSKDFQRHSEEQSQTWASAAAMLLSELADLCGKDLAKIAKKHPNYWNEAA